MRKMKDSGVPWIGEIPEDWILVKIGDVAELLPGYAFSSTDFDPAPDSEVKLIRGINVGVGKIRWDESIGYSGEFSKKIQNYYLESGDIVIGMDRPWINDGFRIAIIKKSDIPSLLVQRVCKIKARNTANQKFLFYMFLTNIFKEHISGTMTGVSVPHISEKQIAKCYFLFPQKGIQDKTVDYLDKKCTKIDAQIAEQESLLTKLESYKKSLIYECVTGKREVPASFVNAS